MHYKLAKLVQCYMQEAPELGDTHNVIYIPRQGLRLTIEGSNLVEWDITRVEHSPDQLTDPTIHTTQGQELHRETYQREGVSFVVYKKIDRIKS